jgi:hypothetical protein
MALSGASRSPSGRVWAPGPRVSEPPSCGRKFTHSAGILSASVCAHIHHNDVMVGKFCSIRFSASRVVAVDRINFQRRSSWTSALQSRVVELFGPERRADVFWVTIGDGLPTQAFTNPKRLAGCLSTFYCGTKVPGDQRRSVAHSSTRSDVAVGPQCHSPIAIDRALWEPGPWSSALFGRLWAHSRPGRCDSHVLSVPSAVKTLFWKCLASLPRLTTPLLTE